MGGENVKEWLAVRFSWLRHYRTDADLSDELKTHCELLEEEYVGAGIPVPEARRRARLALGGRQAVVENVRDQEFISMLESCYRDFVFGLRVLRKNPVFTITATVTLALGIGANAAIFTIVHRVLLRPLGYPKPDQLMYLTAEAPVMGSTRSALSAPEYIEFRQINRSFADVGAYSTGGAAYTTGEVNLTAGDRPLRVRSISVDAHLLRALSIRPEQGTLLR